MINIKLDKKDLKGFLALHILKKDKITEEELEKMELIETEDSYTLQVDMSFEELTANYEKE